MIVGSLGSQLCPPVCLLTVCGHTCDNTNCASAKWPPMKGALRLDGKAHTPSSAALILSLDGSWQTPNPVGAT
jgi:hypothetical protein